MRPRRSSRAEAIEAAPGPGRHSFIRGKLADKAALEAVFERYHPSLVANLAAQGGVRYSTESPWPFDTEAQTTAAYLHIQQIRFSETVRPSFLCSRREASLSFVT